MKSLLNRFTGRSTPQRSRPTRRFQPRFQALESRLLLAGDGDGPALQHEDPVGEVAAEVAPPPTQEVQDEIADLLKQLRRLQNTQVTIEVRFISLNDEFFEQIGVDFDVNFDDNLSPQAEDEGPSVTVGFDGLTGLPTADLDIVFENGSIGLTPSLGETGETPSTIGFAILSDIEAFFLLQASQADNRGDITQAPEVTMFNGQFASISDQTQRPFVISVTPVVG